MAKMNMMLWWDDSGLTAEEKIGRAKSYYTNKTGQVPNVCLVDLGMIAEEKEIAGMRVIPDKRVMRHYLWLGVEEVAG